MMYHWELELDEGYIDESGLYWDPDDCLADAICYCADNKISKCQIFVIGGIGGGLGDLDHDFRQFEYLA